MPGPVTLPGPIIPFIGVTGYSLIRWLRFKERVSNNDFEKSLDLSSLMGYLATVLASINVFGGFVVTQRMLAMYKKKNKND